MNLEGENFNAYEELLVSIEANIQKLNLLIGICDDTQFRDEIIEAYEAELEEEIACYRITIQPDKPSIRFLLEDLIQQHPEIKGQDRVVVTVLGAEKLRFLHLEEFGRSEVEEFAGYMQWTREGLRQFPFSIVLWITSNIEIVLKQKAPDFWSWRKGVFRFTTKPRDFVRTESLQPIIQFLGKDAASEYTSLIPLDDLKALIQKIEAKDSNDTRLPALYESLGDIYSQRLDQGECRNEHQEAQQGIDCFNKLLASSKKDSEKTATWLDKIAYLKWLQGKYSEAEYLYTEALEIKQHLFEGDHSSIATSLNQLAIFYLAQENKVKAEPLIEEALAMEQRLFMANRESTETLTIAQRELYEWIADYICTHQHPPSIRQMMRAMNLKSPAPVQSRLERLRNKGYIDWTEGKARTIRLVHWEDVNNYSGLVTAFNDLPNREAELTSNETLATRQNLLVDKHKQATEALTMVQRELYEWLADYICIHQHSPSIRQMMRAMNLKSPAPVQSRLERLRNKGYIDWTEGKVRTIRLLNWENADNHPDLATSLNNLANLYNLQGRYTEALSLYQQALNIFEDKLGQDHPYIVTVRNNVASLEKQISIF
jgi:SOS-response transcriptional repressor LexA